jgi:hypothetical protein
MKLLSCNTMREGVIVSGAFLVVGATLIFFAAYLLPSTNISYLPLIANFLGIVSLLLAPLILISTFIATVMWPGSKKKLDQCDH